MADLSPAAQAVLDAINNTINEAFVTGTPATFAQVSAAALRAAADQVVSSVPPPCADFDEHAKGFLAAHVKYRRDLLVIAAELKGQQ